MFKKAKKMASIAKRIGECQANHPAAWKLGTQLADEAYETRSEYLREQTSNNDGANQYIRLAGEHLLTSLGDGSLDDQFGVTFPEPLNDSSAACFGIAFSMRLRDRFDGDGITS